MITSCWRRFGLAFLIGALFPLSPARPAGAAVLAGLKSWPAWRGDGTGISREKNLPVAWDAAHNIAWRTPLPGEGVSSPIVSGGRVYLTASEEGGKKRLVICLDAATGGILWQTELAAEFVAATDPKTGYAAPTPATDGERVVAFFDSPGLVCLDTAGKLLWTRPLGRFRTGWNMGGSPVFYKDTILLSCDHQGGGFLIAVDRATGSVRWKTARRPGEHYSTPMVITAAGKDQVVVNGSVVVGYDPDTGQELWWTKGMNLECVPTVAWYEGMAWAASGRNGPVIAVDPAGRGDVNETHVRVSLTTGGPMIPSLLPLSLLVLPRDDGLLRFVDKSGKVVLEHRVRARFTSSPVAGDGKLYWATENCDTYVLDVTGLSASRPTVKLLSVNRLAERCLASPAIAGQRLYLRTAKALYCIAGKGTVASGIVTAAGPATFEQLKERYEARYPTRDDEVIAHADVVDGLAALQDPRAVPLLEEIARRNASFDIKESAVMALGQHGAEAVPALIRELGANRPYLIVVAAECLGRLRAPEAAEPLMRTASNDDRVIRIASLRALAQIALADDGRRAQILPVLIAGLSDGEGVVKEAAIEGLELLAGKVGDRRPAIVDALKALSTDRNPRVAARAKAALAKAYRGK